MSNPLARYHARAPRYILDTTDDHLIRVAGPKQTPWEEGTEILNVSLTGLAFTAQDDLCPTLGEVIKIQFQIPGGKQMACYAVVTRLEQYAKHKTLVAVSFHKLEMAHRIALAQGLSLKFKAQKKSFGDADVKLRSLIPKLLFMALAAWLWVFFVFSLTQIGPEGWGSILSLLLSFPGPN
ncbi:MAG: PilZ domain-containing protein [Bdellovibrionaceae bacterium]|nr:PilZ domain-containing protein [Pseudobdellovibrionaceae bacterium]